MSSFFTTYCLFDQITHIVSLSMHLLCSCCFSLSLAVVDVVIHIVKNLMISLLAAPLLDGHRHSAND